MGNDPYYMYGGREGYENKTKAERRLIDGMVDKGELFLKETHYYIRRTKWHIDSRTDKVVWPYWEVMISQCYFDPKHKFPVFHNEEIMCETKAEAEQILLLRKLEEES